MTRSKTRSKTGEAIIPQRRTPAALKELRRFIEESQQSNDLDRWRRGRAILGYIEGRSVIDMAREYDVNRSSINRWMGWYNAMGVNGLETGVPPGATPRLSEEQTHELIQLIETGPISAGYSSGVWTGPMIADLIEERFGVRYHNHHIPRLLHKLGFSVQRPRKRLARADSDAQDIWIRKKFPAIKKKRKPVAES